MVFGSHTHARETGEFGMDGLEKKVCFDNIT